MNTHSPTIYVDADACPVKDEVYRVAERHGLKVVLVSNASFYRPDKPWIEMVVVGNGMDAADDWIAEHAQQDDIVITDDIPLASRALKAGAGGVKPNGREFTEAAIGETLASREIMAHLRTHGMVTGGPAPFQAKDRSKFLQQLENIVRVVVKRAGERKPL